MLEQTSHEHPNDVFERSEATLRNDVDGYHAINIEYLSDHVEFRS